MSRVIPFVTASAAESKDASHTSSGSGPDPHHRHSRNRQGLLRAAVPAQVAPGDDILIASPRAMPASPYQAAERPTCTTSPSAARWHLDQLPNHPFRLARLEELESIEATHGELQQEVVSTLTTRAPQDHANLEGIPQDVKLPGPSCSSTSTRAHRFRLNAQAGIPLVSLNDTDSEPTPATSPFRQRRRQRAVELIKLLADPSSRYAGSAKRSPRPQFQRPARRSKRTWPALPSRKPSRPPRLSRLPAFRIRDVRPSLIAASP